MAERLNEILLLETFEKQKNLISKENGCRKLWDDFKKQFDIVAPLYPFTDSVGKTRRKTGSKAMAHNSGRADGQTTKKAKPKFCNVCGKEHYWQHCTKLKELKKEKLIRFFDNVHHDKDGNELPVRDNEAVLIKYADKFPTAGPRTA